MFLGIPHPDTGKSLDCLDGYRSASHPAIPNARHYGDNMEPDQIETSATNLNVRAVNAVSRAVGEVRRILGTRAAAKALPQIFAKAGIHIEPAEPEQRELELSEVPDR
jgi:hypothetical protein